MNRLDPLDATDKPDGGPRKLRIAVFNRTFSSTGGGAERFSIAMVEQLAARHEIHVFAQEINHDWPQVTYHRISCPLRKPRWVNQLWFAACTWWATRHGFDVVHSHENTWHGDVQTVHVLPVKYNLFHGRHGWRRLARWVKVGTSPRLLTYLGLEALRYSPHLGRQVVVTSDSLQTIVRSTYAACSGMLAVITPGIVMPELSASIERKNGARKSLGLPEASQCLLFVGNDYRKKGLGTLLEALALLPPEVVLAVVGNPSHIQLFREQVSRLKLSGRVFFLGSLRDVSVAYEAADCLVHPTLEDTFAMVVLEAMAYGVPVIVSGPKYCGIAGLLQNQVNAVILDDPKDAPRLRITLQQVLAQPGLRSKLIQQGRMFASQHEWSELARKQEALYLSVAAEKRNASAL